METSLEEQLVEERDELMIKADNAAGPYRRKGWFLKPQDYIFGRDIEVVPFLPSLKRPNSDWLSKHAHKITFKGWPNPQPNWEQWVDKMSRSYGNTWKQAGIYDAIQVSTIKIRRDPTSFWEVLSYWNCETNTFVFPSFEATMTLEDMMILGGFSPLGLCVREVENLSGELEEINLRLVRAHKFFNKTKAKKASYYAWMNHFMECNDVMIEHIAFLSLWLSRYVFPRAPGDVIQRELFPLAILLGQGERFALGPAVLASLYRDMSFLISNGKNDNIPIFLWAPFGLLQMWIWEHFLSLRQHAYPKLIEQNKPRAIRWHNLPINKTPYPELAIESVHSFKWRPYAEILDNWNLPAYYKENGHWISSNELKDEWYVSFVHCVKAGELVGLDSYQIYLPYRVARQFGYDQDVLGCAKINFRVSSWEVAWSLYKNDGMNSLLYIPPRHFESEATDQYNSWWKENIYRYSSDDEMEEKNDIWTISMKKQKLETDLNTTPLKGSFLEGLARVNVKIIKAVARTIKASSTDVTHNHGAVGAINCGTSRSKPQLNQDEGEGNT